MTTTPRSFISDSQQAQNKHNRLNADPLVTRSRGASPIRDYTVITEKVGTLYRLCIGEFMNKASGSFYEKTYFSKWVYGYTAEGQLLGERWGTTISTDSYSPGSTEYVPAVINEEFFPSDEAFEAYKIWALSEGWFEPVHIPSRLDK